MRLLCHACVAEQVDGNPQHVTQPRKWRRNIYYTPLLVHTLIAKMVCILLILSLYSYKFSSYATIGGMIINGK